MTPAAYFYLSFLYPLTLSGSVGLFELSQGSASLHVNLQSTLGVGKIPWKGT